MAKFIFDNEEEQKGGNWAWHHGTMVEDDKDYSFSLLAMYEPLNDTYSFEVTWVDETPENSNELEKELISEFQSK
jgi:hypothetical protein